jgi:hypothetical protein
VKAVEIPHIVVLVAVGIWILMMSVAQLVREDPDVLLILRLVGALFAAFLGALTVPDFVAAIGLLARQRWARVLGIVVGFLNLPGFPMGTLVGAYAISVLLQDSAKSYFDPPCSRLGTVPRPA